MEQPIRIAVVDDHPLFCQGLVRTFRSRDEVELVGVGENCEAAVRIVREFEPDVVLLDLHLPGGGLQAAQSIKGLRGATKIIFLTASEDEEDLSSALGTGASGYVLKRATADELLDIVQAVHKGATYVTPDLAARVLRKMSERQDERHEPDPIFLTRREEDILQGVSLGQTNKEIAQNLHIGEKTVKQYMTNIMDKLQVRNRVEAALKAKARYFGRTQNGRR